MFPKNKVPTLYANCIPVNGANRSVICDLQLNNFEFIPNELFNILKSYENKSIDYVKSEYEESEREIIDEYYSYLSEKGFIFFTDIPESFPRLSMFWDEPSIVTNAIIDYNSKIDINWSKLIEEFEKLSCKFLQIRCFNYENLVDLATLISLFENKRIYSIELFIRFNTDINKETLQKHFSSFSRISNIYVHSADSTELVHKSLTDRGNIYYTTQEIGSVTHCGIILSDYFSININTYTEAQVHNTCLNRKISIDTEGYIRNCPSMKEHYGNIKDTTLQQAIEHPDFKKYWFVNKDQIAVCKDCEFRYICTDCRAYIENPEDMYSKPLKCGYNPYTCEWEEWSTNPLKQKAIDHYQMREIIPPQN
jgi:SPASM domain peptide maturase of grasp-with-spasm system